MSTTTVTPLPLESSSSRWLVRLSDYWELTRPKIALLVLATVAAGAFLARWALPDGWLLTSALIGTALVASGASIANQWLERFTDRKMLRTADRPLAAGRLGEIEALALVLATTLPGLAILWFGASPAAALWAAASWLIYVVMYTPMKTMSVWNTQVGAISGALPVIIGWTAIEGELSLRVVALTAIVFLWQFPHFMAIAWLYRGQYSQAGILMLTVVDPSGRRAGAQAVVGAAAVLLVSAVPAWCAYTLSPAGALAYLAVALVLGLLQLACAAWFYLHPCETSSRWLLRASLVYLPGVLVMVVAIPWWHWV